MEKNTTPLVDEHLDYLRGMQEVTTDDFFYTRLKARMERQEPQGWGFSLKPVWVIGGLFLLLAVNGFMLTQRAGSKKQGTTATPTLQSFAQSYDQVISSSY